jgi:hypothetical protein
MVTEFEGFGLTCGPLPGAGLEREDAHSEVQSE